MRILILLDNLIADKKSVADVALEKIKADYAPATPVVWEYTPKDCSTLRWVDYQPNAKGIAWDIVYKDLNAIPKDKYDAVIYLLSEENWKSPGIGGWNLGTPINGMAVQLIRIYVNQPATLYKTFAMEIAHSLNDMAIQEINDNLLADFGVNDFDNEVIHGNDPRYGVNVPVPPVMSEYHTTYEYAPMIAIAKDKLSQAYAKRLERYTNPPVFMFTKNLQFGMRSNDVLELQKRFVKEGLATYAPSGFFGLLTLASAIAYQKKYGILPARGFVYEKTRAVLNSAPVEAIEVSEIMK